MIDVKKFPGNFAEGINFERESYKTNMMNRKNFLKTLTFGAMSTGLLLSACGGDAPESKKADTGEAPATQPPAASSNADCNDLSALTDAEKDQRNLSEYVPKSLDPEKNCGNCRFRKPASEPNGCDGCQLFKGPVNAAGNCKAWFKKDA